MNLYRADLGASPGRRGLLTAGLGVLAPVAHAQVASGAQRVVLNVVTAWSEKQASMATLLDRFAQRVFDLSGGSLVIRGQHQEQGGIAAPDLLDAVASGRIDMAHASAQQWTKRSAGFQFFSAVPFGMTAQEHYAWLRLGGGMDLWRKLAAKFGVEVLPCGNTGMQMSGWFRNKVTSAADLRGLKLRFSGLAGEVFKRLGAVQVATPPGDIKAALKKGELDGAQWAAPWDDLNLGLHEVCSHYYHPGVLQPGHMLELLINPGVWSRLSRTHQEVLRTASWLECSDTLAQSSHENARALPAMARIPKLQLLRFPPDVIRALRKAAPEAMRDAMVGDAQANEIFKSYSAYQQQQLRWAELSDRAYWQARYT